MAHQDLALSATEFQIAHGKASFVKPERLAKLARENCGQGRGMSQGIQVSSHHNIYNMKCFNCGRELKRFSTLTVATPASRPLTDGDELPLRCLSKARATSGAILPKPRFERISTSFAPSFAVLCLQDLDTMLDNSPGMRKTPEEQVV